MAINGVKRRIGFFGERKAARYLKRRGYKVLERNYKCKLGEVDIIAKKDDCIAFVEVKTRTSDAFGSPNEAVDAERIRRYRNVANLYFYRSGLAITDYIIRFDIVEVTPDGVNHIENAFF